MEASDISYSEATGLAAEHLKNGVFDFHAFQKDWRHQKNLIIVQEIAQEHMGITDLEQQPQLRDALLDALQRII